MQCIMDQFNEVFSSDFIQGVKDCERGIPHKEGMTDPYNRGYATQYTKEQIQSEQSK